ARQVFPAERRKRELGQGFLRHRRAVVAVVKLAGVAVGGERGVERGIGGKAPREIGPQRGAVDDLALGVRIAGILLEEIRLVLVVQRRGERRGEDSKVRYRRAIVLRQRLPEARQEDAADRRHRRRRIG